MLTKKNDFLEAMEGLNNAIINKQVAEIPALKMALDAALVELNKVEKAEAFADLLADENPAMAIVKMGEIVLTTAKTDKDGRFKEETKTETIDIKEFESFTMDDIFMKSRFLSYIEALNHAVVDHLCGKIGATTRGKKLQGFQLSATAKMIGISAADMATTEGMTKALQNVTDAVVEGLVITPEDAEKMIYTIMRDGRAINSVALATEVRFRRSLMKIWNRAANDKEFVTE